MVDEQGKPVNPANYLPIISATEDEVVMLARAIQNEGAQGGDSADQSGNARAAVAWEAIHRLNTPGFAKTMIGVLEEGYHPYAEGPMEEARPMSINIARNCLAGTMADPVAQSPITKDWVAPSLFHRSWHAWKEHHYTEEGIAAAGCVLIKCDGLPGFGNVFSDIDEKHH